MFFVIYKRYFSISIDRFIDDRHIYYVIFTTGYLYGSIYTCECLYIAGGFEKYAEINAKYLQ